MQARVAQKFGAELGDGRLKILSFGCSTGDEVSTLRGYFPEALLFACDVNPEALRTAKETLLSDEAVVFESTRDAIAAHGPFDVIFAMSVLCRFPESRNQDLSNISALYPFTQFEDTTAWLASNLRGSGILCLYNTTYDFRHTKAARDFRAVRSALIPSNGFVDRFAENGRRMTLCEAAEMALRVVEAVLVPGGQCEVGLAREHGNRC